jgi:uncharacterized protein (DUF2384 family)
MGRGQKLKNTRGESVGNMRAVDPPRNPSKLLKAVNPTIANGRVRRREGEVSRASVAAHALATFGSPEKVQHWMNRPNPLFQGKTPAQVIEFDLVGVEAELVRIDHGVYM